MNIMDGVEIKIEKLDQTFDVKKETLKNKEVDDELKHGLDVLETLNSKIKDESLDDFKPKFSQKNKVKKHKELAKPPPSAAFIDID